MKHLIVDSEGIKLAEMPEEPQDWMSAIGFDWNEYEAAKKKAIAEAKLFEDQEMVKKYLPNDEWGRSPFDPKYNPDKTMPPPPDFPEYVEVRQVKMISGEWMDVEEVNFQNVDCEPEIRKALRLVEKEEHGNILRFVDKQEERKGESQEGLWDDFWGELIAEGFDTENCKRVQGKYTIKRK